MNEDDYEFSDDDLQEGARAKKLPERRTKLGGAVPVRFDPDVVERIKIHAAREGQTVSSWIRSIVDDALSGRERTVVYLPLQRTGMSGADSQRLSLVQHG